MSLGSSGWRCLRCARGQRQSPTTSLVQRRPISATRLAREEQDVLEEPPASLEAARRKLDPQRVATPRLERKLVRETKQQPVGSRRRRAALLRARPIPFEQMPYQCFQEARKILAEDRKEKLAQIQSQRERIQRIRNQNVEPQQERSKERRLISMEQHLEELKIWADINDPIVKKTFEDGLGDLNKPIYRHLLQKKWESYAKKINIQRIQQFNLVPDILQALDPEVALDIKFGRHKVDPGEYIASLVSERPPALSIQSFRKGERLVTIALINPDVPNVAEDAFDYRCHYLACNVMIAPTSPHVSLSRLDSASQVLLDWLPAYNQKGAPYHRMAFFILEQPNKVPIDVAAASAKVKREGFKLRSFVDRYGVQPIGANLFRTQWDEGTREVMQRLGVPGHDVEFKRMKVEPLPYKRLPGSRYR